MNHFEQLSQLIKEQAAHGVYISPDTWTDAMYLLHLRCEQAVFSHETALFFHDLLRSRSRIEIQVFQDALKQYVRRKDKNLRTLMRYAAMFHVEKLLRQYLEVLL